VIRDAGERLGRALLDGIGRVAGRFQEHRSLPADLLESDDAYLAVFDAPGATAENISVRCRGNTLTISIDRFREFRDGYEMCFPGRGLALAGEVELPQGATVDADAADATLTRAGTVEVLVPKIEHADA
jgi:HSP20 family molecular chaperone IbpA